MQFNITAVKQLDSLFLKNPESRFFRIYIQGGGCTGFEYGFEMVKHSEPDDLVFHYTEEKDAGVCIIDPISYEYIEGSLLDYEKNLSGARFVLKNPREIGHCGCGRSVMLDTGASRQTASEETLLKHLVTIYPDMRCMFKKNKVSDESSDVSFVIVTEGSYPIKEDLLKIDGRFVKVFLIDYEETDAYLTIQSEKNCWNELCSVIVSSREIFGNLTIAEQIKRKFEESYVNGPQVKDRVLRQRLYDIKEKTSDLDHCGDEYERIFLFDQVFSLWVWIYCTENQKWVDEKRSFIGEISKDNQEKASFFYTILLKRDSLELMTLVNQLMNKYKEMM